MGKELERWKLCSGSIGARLTEAFPGHTRGPGPAFLPFAKITQQITSQTGQGSTSPAGGARELLGPFPSVHPQPPPLFQEGIEKQTRGPQSLLLAREVERQNSRVTPL